MFVRLKSIFFRAGSLFLGLATFNFGQMLVVVVIAKLGTIDDVGNYALALSYVLPFVQLTRLQLRSLYVSNQSSTQPDFSLFLSLTLLSTFAGIVLGTAVALLLLERQMAVLAVSILIVRSIENISELFYGLAQRKYKMRQIGISLILRGISTAIVFPVIYYTCQNSSISILIVGVFWLWILFMYDIPANCRAAGMARMSLLSAFAGALNIDLGRYRSLVLSGFSLGLVLVIAAGMDSLPRIFLAQHISVTELGVFSAILQLPMSARILMTSVGQVVLPSIANAYREEKYRDFLRFLGISIGIAILTGLMGFGLSWLLGENILRILYTSEVAEQTSLLLLLTTVSTASFIFTFIGQALTAAGVYNRQLVIFIVAALVEMVSCLMLIPGQGAWGAGLSLGIAYVTQCLLGSWFLFRKLRSVLR
jgi:O-antigen/teichoic acid export membrane protein